MSPISKMGSNSARRRGKLNCHPEPTTGAVAPVHAVRAMGPTLAPGRGERTSACAHRRRAQWHPAPAARSGLPTEMLGRALQARAANARVTKTRKQLWGLARAWRSALRLACARSAAELEHANESQACSLPSHPHTQAHGCAGAAARRAAGVRRRVPAQGRHPPAQHAGRAPPPLSPLFVLAPIPLHTESLHLLRIYLFEGWQRRAT